MAGALGWEGVQKMHIRGVEVSSNGCFARRRFGVSRCKESIPNKKYTWHMDCYSKVYELEFEIQITDSGN